MRVLGLIVCAPTIIPTHCCIVLLCCFTALLAATVQISFTLALQHRSLDQFQSLFDSISDPRHERYQSYMTPAEITALIAPNKQDTDTVLDWLHSHDIASEHIVSSGDAVHVRCNATTAELLFHTTFHHFTHADYNSVVRTNSYSIPRKLSHIIQMITGLSAFPAPHYRLTPKVQKQSANAAAAEPVGTLPSTWQTLYNIPPQTVASAPETSVAAISFFGYSYAPGDVESFASQLNIRIQNVTANHTIGPNNPDQPMQEPDMDMLLIQTTNIESTPWFWLQANPSDWLYEFTVDLFNAAEVPQVVSLSWAW